MLDFDEVIYAQTKANDAYYQRYSDDLIIVCDQKDEALFFKLIQDSISQLVDLTIQPEKTKIYRYQKDGNKFSGGIAAKEGIFSPNRQLEYLGFQYDGSNVRVKTVGFSKFYRSMKRSHQ